MSAGRLLIVNADDYALTEGVSRAILRAADEGIVTSTSVLAIGPAFERAVPALVASGLAAGAHLAAVGEDPPLLSAAEIPTLVDRRGRLPSSWRVFLPRLAVGRIDPVDVRTEFAAQLERLHGAGVDVTHVDTHQHLHLWPAIAGVVLDVAAEAGIGALRIIRSASRAPVGAAVRRLALGLERRAGGRGFRFPATATGLDEAGTLAGDRLAAAIGRLAASGAASAELATHPGEAADPELARYRWGYRWADELAALCAPEARRHVDRCGFRLGSYRDLAPA